MYKVLGVDGGLVLTDKGLVAVTPAYHTTELGNVRSMEPATYQFVLKLIQHGPELLTHLKGLLSLLATVRQDQVSQAMGFGSTPNEKRERAAYLARVIQRHCLEVNDALEKAQALVKEVDGKS